ncbi:hypothetical protein [Eubacterium callanderi]|uniref:hypothetical protein n=1 Tax=Eubacterium callanderi TaxID=53442 RepID=UPI001AA0CB1F|nr:hypothetical protein [Eubacterium callanderi]MBO1702920.1 hypothetical protein [Eubacterium callanderi]
MDIDFYPDKNRVIRLIKEVANGQYKGDLNAVSKWLESSAELVGVNFFKTEKEISINFGCMRKMYDDIHDAYPVYMDTFKKKITQNSVFMVDLTQSKPLDFEQYLDEDETKDSLVGEIIVTMSKDWNHSASVATLQEYVLAHIDSKIDLLQKQIMPEDNLNLYRNHVIITNLLRENKDEIEGFLTENQFFDFWRGGRYERYETLQNAASSFSNCPEALNSIANLLTDEQVNFSAYHAHKTTINPSEISFNNDLINETIASLENYRERYKRETGQLNILDEKYNFDSEMDEER